MAEYSAQELIYFEVEVSYEGEGSAQSGLSDTGLLATWRGLAKDKGHAQEQALDACWDERLNAASCSPRISSREACRYLLSTDWLEVADDGVESRTRWLYDRGTKDLVHAEAQVFPAAGGCADWQPMEAQQRARLLEGLRADNVLDDNGIFDDVVEVSSAIDWHSHIGSVPAADDSIKAVKNERMR